LVRGGKGGRREKGEGECLKEGEEGGRERGGRVFE